jgi:tRNA (guanine37-N1)-methyltransferase
VLSGGELPAMVLLEAMTRLIPGVLNDIESALTDSFSRRDSFEPSSLLEGPVYTRPEEFQEMRVPDVLLSGDHRKIADWRAEKALEITRRNRPDLWERHTKKTTPSGQ